MAAEYVLTTADVTDVESIITASETYPTLVDALVSLIDYCHAEQCRLSPKAARGDSEVLCGLFRNADHQVVGSYTLWQH